MNNHPLQLFPPADDLRPFVRGYFVRRGAGAFSRSHFPSVVYPTLGLTLGGTILLELCDGTLRPLPNVFFSGALTHPTVSANVGAVLSVSFLFHPGVVPHLLGEDPDTLVDTLVDAEDLWPREAAALGSRVYGMAIAQAIPIIEEFIRGRLRIRRRSTGFEDLHTARIAREISRLSLSEIVTRSGLSLRQFERRFLAQYGMRPKLFQRLRRFERAVYAMGDDHFRTSNRLANIAAECGYFDQSHFIKDFRRFSGLNPKGLLDHVESKPDEFWSYRLATPTRSTF